jgi:hypothetical protein
MSGARRARVAIAVGLAAFGMIAAACAKPSEEARIRALLEKAADLAEDRDLPGLTELFLDDYADFEGRDKAGTVRLVTDHLSRYRGVVVHILGVRADAIGPDGRADVGCEIALSHGAAEVLRRLVRLGSEYYRFELGLRKDGAGEWRFAYAGWEEIGLGELLPESLEILRKLFPEL